MKKVPVMVAKLYDSISKFSSSKVLITGNTGFKGSWLAAWLSQLGAEVRGISKDIRSDPSLYLELEHDKKLKTEFLDVNDLVGVRRVLEDFRPDFVFHLAAQAIVSRGYAEPHETWATNALGTASVLEALKTSSIQDTKVVMITSDKVYKNKEWPWGYRETDEMGGHDPYSSSKAAAELAIQSYARGDWVSDRNLSIGSARAGNVIGGGDWSTDRIVPDTVRAWREGTPVKLRYPEATRPWQHVLEPLGGYLQMALALADGRLENGESLNFGPSENSSKTVETLVTLLTHKFNMQQPEVLVMDAKTPKESGLLRLSSEKAMHLISWKPTLDFQTTMNWVGDWYKAFYETNQATEFTNSQINEFQTLLYAEQ